MEYHCFLPEKSSSDNILVILDDPLGQKVNFKVKYVIYMLQIGARITHCFGVILTGLSNSSRVLMIKVKWLGDEKALKGGVEALKSGRIAIQVKGEAWEGNRVALKDNRRRLRAATRRWKAAQWP